MVIFVEIYMNQIIQPTDYYLIQLAMYFTFYCSENRYCGNFIEIKLKVEIQLPKFCTLLYSMEIIQNKAWEFSRESQN